MKNDRSQYKRNLTKAKKAKRAAKKRSKAASRLMRCGLMVTVTSQESGLEFTVSPALLPPELRIQAMKTWVENPSQRRKRRVEISATPDQFFGACKHSKKIYELAFEEPAPDHDWSWEVTDLREQERLEDEELERQSQGEAA
jgi:hypothetical protein